MSAPNDQTAYKLLMGVRERPYDDAPKLILADRLEEIGEIEAANCLVQSVRGKCWVGFPPEFGDRWQPVTGFYNGLPGRQIQNILERNIVSLLASGGDAQHWLLSLTVIPEIQMTTLLLGLKRITSEFPNLVHLDVSSRPVTYDNILEFANVPLLAQISMLDLGKCHLNPDLIQAFVNRGGLQNLTHLNLRENRIGPPGIEAITNSPHCKNLIDLNLTNNQIEHAGFQSIIESRYLSSLQYLNLKGNSIPSVEGFIVCENMIGVVSLDLSANRLHSSEGLADSVYLEDLTHLNLEFCKLGSDHLRDIINSPYLGKLTSLDLGYNRIDEFGAKELAEWPQLLQFTELKLRHNRLRLKGVQELIRSPYLENIRSLDLRGNRITWEAFLEIAQSPKLKNLEELLLKGNVIRGQFKPEVLKTHSLENLKKLDLRKNLMDRYPNFWLSDSPLLDQLEWLGIDDSVLRHNSKLAAKIKQQQATFR